MAYIIALISITVILGVRRRKRVSFEHEAFRLFTLSDHVDNGAIQVFFRGEPAQEAYLVVARFTNSGNVSIRPQDYYEPLRVAFSHTTKILTAEVAETRPRTLTLAVDIQGSTVRLQSVLLNRGDSVTIKVIVSCFDGQVWPTARIADVTRIRSLRRGRALGLAGRALAGGGLALGLAGVVVFILRLLGGAGQARAPIPLDLSLLGFGSVLYAVGLSFVAQPWARQADRRTPVTMADRKTRLMLAPPEEPALPAGQTLVEGAPPGASPVSQPGASGLPVAAPAVGIPGRGRLIITRGAQLGAEFPLNPGENEIGRWDDEEGFMPHIDLGPQDIEGYVHRRHALVRFDGAQWSLEHLKPAPSNPTRIRGRGDRLEVGQPAVLNPGDEIVVGRVILKFVVE